MHLLNIEQSGDLYTSGEAVDLAQSPGRIVILTAADSEISLMAAAARARGLAAGDLRLANLLALNHPFSVDIYVEKTLAQAQLILVRLLGGAGYWAYGVEQLSALAKEKNIHLAMIAGDGRPDAELANYSTLPPEILAQLAAYLDHGGLDNAEALLMALDDIINDTNTAPPPRPLLKAGLYWHDARVVDFADMEAIWRGAHLDEDAPIAAVVCYRALMQGGAVRADGRADFRADGAGDSRLAPLCREPQRCRIQRSDRLAFASSRCGRDYQRHQFRRIRPRQPRQYGCTLRKIPHAIPGGVRRRGCARDSNHAQRQHPIAMARQPRRFDPARFGYECGVARIGWAHYQPCHWIQNPAKTRPPNRSHDQRLRSASRAVCLGGRIGKKIG